MASLSDLKCELESVTKSVSEVQQKVQSLLERQEKLQARKSELELEIKRRETVYTNLSSDGKEASWKSNDFPWSEQLKAVLWEKFKIKKLREMQLETMNATMSKRDVILIMPTGGGKSLCYQAPAMLSGLTLVISPLISLIEDQILALQNFGIYATKLCASTPKEEVTATHKEMIAKKSTLKLLYVTPEKISKSKRFMAQLEKCYKAGNLSRIAIDEVHCASQWGNDFRPDYKILGILKRQFPETPILGLTATSTDKVTLDTKKILNIPFAMVFKTGLNRPNLFYEVRPKPDSYDMAIHDICTTIRSLFPQSSGIIYCFSCKNCEEVSKSLCKRGISAAVYHARMEPQDRHEVHKAWLENKVKVICATIAFGMGIDKSDVRYVFHFTMSKSIENYYQESGRAGRDGNPALCLLYYGFADIFRQSTMVLTEHTGLMNLTKVLQYCQNTKRCRRYILFSHFGNEWTSGMCTNSCDSCCGETHAEPETITELCLELISITQKASFANERLTGAKLVDAANGRGKFKTSIPELKSLDTRNIQRIIVFMILNGYLKEDFHFTPYSTISYLLPGPHASLVRTKEPKLDLSPANTAAQTAFQNFCQKWKCGSNVKEKNERKRLLSGNSDENFQSYPSSSNSKILKPSPDEHIDLTLGDDKSKKAIVISDSSSDDDFT